MKSKKLTAMLTVSAMAASMLLTAQAIPVTAAGSDTLSYPVQEFRFGIGDTDRSITISGTGSGDYVSSAEFIGNRTQKWYLNYISNGVYEIVNSQTGYILTNNGGTAVTAPDKDGANQLWQIKAVSQDFEGNDLYYKIVSNANSSEALTFDVESNSFSVDGYKGNLYQTYKLNLDGLEGFAGNCMVNGKEKAGTIGGLLGETVFCDTVEEVVEALDSREPKTVVVTANLNFVNQSKAKQQIRDDKTLVGSYAANTIVDCQLRNDDLWGKEADTPAGNIVIRNMNFRGEYLNNTGSGNLLLAFYGVRNLWLDHNSFSTTFAQDKSHEVGKFVWINTPAKGWADDKWNAYNPDYITASYNSFLNRYWTFAFGSQNTDTSRLHTTLMFNRWEQCSRRCPQYSNGYDHNYNNYYTVTNGSNPNHSSQVIGGEGSRVINENCRFEGCGPWELDPDRTSCISFTEKGSYTAGSPTSAAAPIKFENHNSDTWKVTDCYGYHLVSAYNTNNTDIKAFCNTYSGARNAYSKLHYITDEECEKYVSASYDAPHLKSIEVGSAPVGNREGAVLDEGALYMIKNVNSGLYLDVDGAKAENGTNIQQWGAAEPGVQNTFRVISAGDGYYYLVSQVGDKATYFLDVANNSTENGANIGIWNKTDADCQKIKFYEVSDGKYMLLTKQTGDKKCLGVQAASKNSGANIVQWQTTLSDPSQHWTLEKVDNDGCEMDTSKIYMFENVNSGLFMDVAYAGTEDGTNVWQWIGDTKKPGTNNSFTLKRFGTTNMYYIMSRLGNYCLKAESSANGANIFLTPYNTKDSSMLFKFVKNPDGSYNILTHASRDNCLVEVANAASGNSGNVAQWEANGNNCQKWNLIEVTIPETKPAAPSAPTITNVEYSSKSHQVRFTWKPVSGAQNYAIAVYLAGRWRIQTQSIEASVTSYTTPKNLIPGKSYKVAVAVKVNGIWSSADAVKHAVTVTVK